jgi:glycosyltransferase involved in cell wall biosynthesis
MIPVYNEAQNIGRVVAEIQVCVPEADILVINDGSTDGTLAVATGLGVAVMDLPYNLGIGGAVQAGLLYARAHSYEWVARLDGDGQHDPAQLPVLLNLVRTGQADAVIGSRFVAGQGYRASWQRAVGIRLFAWAVSLVTRQRYTDTTSGFQAWNREAAAFLATHLPADYPEIEGLIMLNRAGFVVREVGVTMRPRQAGKSSITAVRSLYYICKILLAIFIEMLRQPIRRDR